MKKLTIGVILNVVLLLAACSPSATSSSAGEITVEASEFKFEPSTIEVKVGQKVKLKLRNVGTVEHDFSVMEISTSGLSAQSAGGHDMGHMTKNPQLHVAAKNGKTSTLEFTLTQAGTYEVFCAVAGHKEGGMVARLVVKDS